MRTQYAFNIEDGLFRAFGVFRGYVLLCGFATLPGTFLTQQGKELS